ncbi:MAG: NAD-dependent epimerase/dehydratase family protein [Pseudomonadota bacterium]
MATVLFIGGTGEISFACVEAAARAGHTVTVLNRGRQGVALPDSVTHLYCDLNDPQAYNVLESRCYDVVCQFIAFDVPQIERDIDTFAGRCGHYIFVSSASAYEKPPTTQVITEAVSLRNPYWEYSQRKADCETRLQRAHQEDQLPITIVRPSHTYRTRLPGTVMTGDHLAWRMVNGKALIVHGNGQSLWTLTHADDLARAFTKLFGNGRAMGDAFHITSDEAHPWNHLLTQAAAALGCTAKIVPVPVPDLLQANPDWEGTLLGDKTNDTRFDNTKLRGVIGHWQCEVNLLEGLRRAAVATRKRLGAGYTPDAATDALLDRIADVHSDYG